MQDVKHKGNMVAVKEYEEEGVAAATFLMIEEPEWTGSEFVDWRKL